MAHLIFALTVFVLRIGLVWTVDPSTDNDADCPMCGSVPDSAHDLIDITEEEIRQEMLRWEREHILRKMNMSDSTTRLNSGTQGSHSGKVIRDTRSTVRQLDFNDEGFVRGFNRNFTNEENPQPEDWVERSLFLGQQSKGNPTITYQCYDETYGKIATCIDFPNKTDINWERLKFATLRFQVTPDFAAAEVKNHSVRTRTFAVATLNPKKAISVERKSGNRSVANVTVHIDRLDKYIEIDVTQQVWLRSLEDTTSFARDYDPIIFRITCLTCGNLVRSVISTAPSSKPFLEVAHTSRMKRSSGYCALNKHHLIKEPLQRGCCMVAVNVDFQEIGIGYIVFPSGYLTHYCGGRCQDYNTRSYTAVLQNVVNVKLRRSGYDDKLSLCCTPLIKNPLDVIYRDSEGEVKQAKLVDMVVMSCGC